MVATRSSVAGGPTPDAQGARADVRTGTAGDTRVAEVVASRGASTMLRRMSSIPAPACPHLADCGACGLLARAPEEALALLRRRLEEALAAFPELAPVEVASTVAAPARTGHRTRAKLAVAAVGRGPARIGLFSPGTHDVIDVPGCVALHPGLVPIVATLREALAEPRLAVRHVDLRWSRHEARAHVTLVVGDPRPAAAWRSVATRLLRGHPEVSGVALRRTRGPVGGALFGPTEPLAGEQALVEALAGRRFRLSPGAFFQADPGAAEGLHAAVRAWLAGPSPARHLVDLCAGAGAFAVALADTAECVTAVESVAQAAADARASARLSGVAIDVVEASVERVAAQLPALAPDRLVVDPPRRGLPVDVLAAIGRASPERVAWVACDPEVGARDVAALAPFDLVLRRAVPFELFAGSAEVESLLLLEHVPGAWRPRVLARGDGWCAVSCPSTRAGGSGAGQGLAGAVGRALGGAFQAPPAAPGAPPAWASGVAVLVAPDAHAAALRALAHAALEVVALVRGVPRAKGWLPAAGRQRGARAGGAGRSPDPGPRLRYAREAVVGGYGLARVLVPGLDAGRVLPALAAIGHPVLGDPAGDARANRFAAEVCALHRPFVHVARLAFAPPEEAPVDVTDPLAPDLELAIERLRARRTAELVPRSG